MKETKCQKILREEGSKCPKCGGGLYIKTMLWFGSLMERIKCQDCGCIF